MGNMFYHIYATQAAQFPLAFAVGTVVLTCSFFLETFSGNTFICIL